MRFLFIFLLFCGTIGICSAINAATNQKKQIHKVAKKNHKSHNAKKKQVKQNVKSQHNKNLPKEPGISLVGEFKDWAVQELKDTGVKYLISAPTKSQGTYEKRGKVYLLVSPQEEGKTKRDVVSFVAGYPYKPNSEVTFTFQDNKKYKFFTDRDRAWAIDDATDKAVVAAMKKGSKIKIQGISSNNNETLDEISLSGFQAAYKKYAEPPRK